MKTLLVFWMFCGGVALGQTWRPVEGVPPGPHGGLWRTGDTVLTSQPGVLFRSTDGGGTWAPLPALPPQAPPVTAYLGVGGAHIAGTAGDGVYRLAPGVAVWERESTGLTGLGSLEITAFARDGALVFAATGGAGVFRSAAAGILSWQTHGIGLVSSTSGGVNGFVLRGDTLIAGSGANGYVFVKPASTDAWEGVLLQPPSAPGLQVNDLLIRSDGMLFAAANGRIWRSSGTLSGWARADSGLPVGLFARLAEDRRGNLFLGTSSSAGFARVYVSEDGGFRWRVIGGFPDADLTGLAVAGDRLLASFTDGLRWVGLDSLALAVPREAVPEAFVLDPNYPNPFNPATTLPFRLAEGGARVTLSITDLLGRGVEVLVDGILPRGAHEVRWDAGGRAAGVYVARLVTAGGTSVRKLVLLR